MFLMSIKSLFSPRATVRAELNNINTARPPVPLSAWRRQLPTIAMGAAHDDAIRGTLGFAPPRPCDWS